MKKIISLVLFIAILSSMCIPVFAESSSSINTLSFSDYDNISFLDSHNIEREMFIGKKTESGNQETYLYQVSDNLVSEITVEILPNGYFFTIKEGDLINTLEVTNTGKYILNGNTVKFANTNTISTANANDNVPRFPVDNYYTDTCPYGSPSDYTKYVRSKANANVSFGTAFGQLTVTAFTIVVSAISPVLAGISFSFAATLLAACQSYDPHSTCASYREYQYQHNPKGAFVTLDMSVTMYSMDMWTEANYQGTKIHRVAYEVTIWENGEG